MKSHKFLRTLQFFIKKRILYILKKFVWLFLKIKGSPWSFYRNMRCDFTFFFIIIISYFLFYESYNSICVCVCSGADVLLWRNRQISAGILASGTVIWFLFECVGYHLVTFICHSIILTLSTLFLWSNLAAFTDM